MNWTVDIYPEFETELKKLTPKVQKELFLRVKFLEEFGPQLGRPHADTLKGSQYTNMKELRFYADDGAWRVAFAFDPKRKAILLVAGDKSGTSEKHFYKRLIEKADIRFNAHLQNNASSERK